MIGDSSPTGGDVPETGEVPAIPVSAGALIFDRSGRLLILKPTYKSGWTIPGGVMEADGETPWQACRREVREECGIELGHGRLACVDFRRPKPGSPGGVRFLFDCGRAEDSRLAAIRVQAEEIAEYRLAALPEALELLRRPIRRRVRAATSSRTLVYLEQGRKVAGITNLRATGRHTAATSPSGVRGPGHRTLLVLKMTRRHAASDNQQPARGTNPARYSKFLGSSPAYPDLVAGISSRAHLRGGASQADEDVESKVLLA